MSPIVNREKESSNLLLLQVCLLIFSFFLSNHNIIYKVIERNEIVLIFFLIKASDAWVDSKSRSEGEGKRFTLTNYKMKKQKC